MSKLSELAMRLELKCRASNFKSKDRQLTQELTTTNNADDKSAEVIVNRLGKQVPILKKMQKLIQGTRSHIRCMTQMDGRNSYILPFKGGRWKKIIEYIESRTPELKELKDEARSVLPDIINEIPKNLSGLHRNQTIPTVDDVLDSFSIEYDIEPYPDISQFDNILGFDDEEKKIRKDFEDQQDNIFSNLKDSLKENLLERVDTILEAARNYGIAANNHIFSPRIFNTTLQTVDKVSDLNMENDVRIIDWCKRLRHICNVPIDVHKTDLGRQQLISDLQVLKGELS